MTLPTTEITIFETSNAFRANPDLLLPAFDQLRSKGVKAPIYYGPEAEDPNVGFIFINWDSYKQHKATIDAPFYAELAAGLVPAPVALLGTPKAYHVQFPAPTIALDYPVTEVTILTLKAPENRAGVVEILSGIAEATENLFVFGPTQEDKNKYISICGWESVEAHRKAVSNPESQEKLKQLYSLADEDHMYHAKLKKLGSKLL